MREPRVLHRSGLRLPCRYRATVAGVCVQQNRSPDEVHDFHNGVLFLAGVFKLTVSLFAGDVLTAFDENQS